MTEIRRILCPVDFSETSNHAFDYAVNLAKQLGATIDAVHVFQLPMYAMPDGALIAGADTVSALSDRLQRDLDGLAARFSGRGAPIKTHLLEGIPHVEINRLGAQVSADLVIMGTHGRTGLAHLLIGSVAERVVRTSPVPVLTVRLPERSGKG